MSDNSVAISSLIPERFDQSENLFTHPIFVRLRELNDPEADKLHQRLEKYSIDPGLSRPRNFILNEAPQEGLPTHLHADPVKMYNRMGLIHRVQELIKAEEIDRNTISFQLYDIAGLREADREIDDYGNRSANYVINVVANSIQTAKGEMSLTCRYGGDEFALLLPDAIPETVELADMNIREKINTHHAYFNRNGYHSFENIGLKPGIKAISPPDPAEKPELNHLFWMQFNKGLILSETELLEIRDQLTPEEWQNLLKQDENIIKPPSKQKLGYEIEQFLNKHPIYANIFNDLYNLATKHDKKKRPLFYEAFDYLKRNINDPLLGEVVATFYDLVDDLQTGRSESIMCFDFKGIKEENDYKSIARGDMAIKAMFDQVTEKIPEELRSVVNFYRRGGTLMITVAHGYTQQVMKHIGQLSSVHYGGSSLDIGRSDYMFDARELNIEQNDIEPQTLTEEQSSKIISNALNAADVDWLVKAADKLKDSPNLLDHPPENPEEPLHKGMKRELTTDERYYLYFRGKRQKERCRSELNVVDQILNEYVFPDNNEGMKLLRNKLAQYAA